MFDLWIRDAVADLYVQTLALAKIASTGISQFPRLSTGQSLALGLPAEALSASPMQPRLQKASRPEGRGLKRRSP